MAETVAAVLMTKNCEDWIEGTLKSVAGWVDEIVVIDGFSTDRTVEICRKYTKNVTQNKWDGYRFATEPHCDLAEQFSFYNVSGREGAARKFNLDFYCKAFGIESPKAHGVTGMDVNTLMAGGKFRDIAEYCLRDVRATVELYRVWKERLAGIK